MACPFFYPVAKFDDRTFAIPPRLPLGDPYVGECRAHSPFLTLDEAGLHRACNAGYGRGSCGRFPEDAVEDAIRFHVGDWKPVMIAVQFVTERQCWPLRHGLLHYSKAEQVFVERNEDAIVQRQAEAFIESFLARAA